MRFGRVLPEMHTAVPGGRKVAVAIRGSEISDRAMIITLDKAALPLVLDYRFNMMAEAGMSGLLAPDWRDLTAILYERGQDDGTCVHFGWCEDARIVAVAGALVRTDFPANTFKDRRFGWIMDVYVLPDFRRRGIARHLTAQTLDWLREKGVTYVKLYASAQAKNAKLYERFGFTPTSEMAMQLG